MAKIVPSPLTVIGAGPAGIAAASAAAQTGVQVTVIGENPRPGGNIIANPPQTLILPTRLQRIQAIQRLLANETGRELRALSPLRIRPSIQPVRLCALASEV